MTDDNREASESAQISCDRPDCAADFPYCCPTADATHTGTYTCKYCSRLNTIHRTSTEHVAYGLHTCPCGAVRSISINRKREP